MAVLRCTQKLLTELKTKPSEEVTSFYVLGIWHANLLRIDRRKCILFTHDSTLFSFFVPGLKKPHFENFTEFFRQNLFKNLLRENFLQNQIEIVLDNHREIIIAKTNNRSVLGSMNDLAFQLKYRIAANKFAENAGVKVGSIRSARQGGFNVRDAGEEYGDTAKIEKDVRVVTTIVFYLTE